MSVFNDYLKDTPHDQLAEFARIRSIVHELVPKVEETISYKMPTYKYHGKYLLWVGIFKNHMSIFPDNVQFTPDKPLSDDELTKIIERHLRVIEKLSPDV